MLSFAPLLICLCVASASAWPTKGGFESYKKPDHLESTKGGFIQSTQQLPAQELRYEAPVKGFQQSYKPAESSVQLPLQHLESAPMHTPVYYRPPVYQQAPVYQPIRYEAPKYQAPVRQSFHQQPIVRYESKGLSQPIQSFRQQPIVRYETKGLSQPIQSFQQPELHYQPSSIKSTWSQPAIQTTHQTLAPLPGSQHLEKGVSFQQSQSILPNLQEAPPKSSVQVPEQPSIEMPLKGQVVAPIQSVDAAPTTQTNA